MARRFTAGGSRRKRTESPKLRTRRSRLWPRAAMRKRWLRRLKGAPRGAQIVAGLLLLAALALAINWLYQVVRKPSELFFPVSGTLYKTPSETWRQYGAAFERYSTATISPQLLAALAQVEGSGNPVARTYWRWSWKPHPFEVYRPASSAVGMYQITDGTFSEAKRYCIHDHMVVEDGPWNDWRSCWLNRLYVRVIPSHAIELTSAYLDRAVLATLQRRGVTNASAQQKQELATVIHLCGAGAGDRYARRHFRLTDGQKCGDHEVRGYVQRVNAMKLVFTRLAQAIPP